MWGAFSGALEERVTKSVTKSVTESVTKSVTESVTKSVTESVTKSVRKQDIERAVRMLQALGLQEERILEETVNAWPEAGREEIEEVIRSLPAGSES